MCIKEDGIVQWEIWSYVGLEEQDSVSKKMYDKIIGRQQRRRWNNGRAQEPTNLGLCNYILEPIEQYLRAFGIIN